MFFFNDFALCKHVLCDFVTRILVIQKNYSILGARVVDASLADSRYTASVTKVSRGH